MTRSLLFPLSFFLVPGALFAQQDIGRVIPQDHPLHIVAFGDYGSGSPNQAAVAHAIQQRHKAVPFDMGITMGDNFYQCGVRSVTDSKWKTRYEDLYSPLGIKFYAALGNHDYGHPPIICPAERGSPVAEVAYTAHSATWRMPDRYYAYTAGPVLFIAIDTEGWTNTQLEWIKKTLADHANDAGIKWRLVYGHHPIFTSGVHLNERRIAVLRSDLLPVLKDAHVDLYVCGHDHDMEHLRQDGMDFFIAGGGGAHLRAFHRQEPNSLFEAVHFGFLDLSIDEHKADVQFYDVNLKPLESPEFVRTK